MFRIIGLVLLSPLFAVGFLLRLAFFVPFAVLFLLPAVLMRPRLILKAPQIFRFMLMSRRRGWGGCGPRGRWGRGRRLEAVREPVRL